MPERRSPIPYSSESVFSWRGKYFRLKSWLNLHARRSKSSAMILTSYSGRYSRIRSRKPVNDSPCSSSSMKYAREGGPLINLRARTDSGNTGGGPTSFVCSSACAEGGLSPLARAAALKQACSFSRLRVSRSYILFALGHSPLQAIYRHQCLGAVHLGLGDSHIDFRLDSGHRIVIKLAVFHGDTVGQVNQ